MINNSKFYRCGVALPIVLAVAGVVALTAVLGLAVWRIQDIRTVLQRPRATGTACTTDPGCPDTERCNNGTCVSVVCPRMPTDGCWSFNISNHACNRVNEPNGTACTAAGAGGTCQNGVCTGGNTVIPNCSNLTGPNLLIMGQSGTFEADFYSQVADSKGRIEIVDPGRSPAPLQPPYGSWQNEVVSLETNTISGNSGKGSVTWTPTVAGAYFLFCRAWNDAIAECRGDSRYVDGPPRYACAGPNSSMTVTVVPAAYSCSGTSCVLDPHGRYFNSNCDGACSVPPPPNTANECEVCEGLAGKSCASGLVCRRVANDNPDQGGICVKSDGTTKCGPCSSDSSCTPPLMCVED